MHQNKPDLLTKQDIMDRFQVSLRTVDRWIESGALTPVKLPSRHVRFRAEDVDQLAKGLPA